MEVENHRVEVLNQPLNEILDWLNAHVRHHVDVSTDFRTMVLVFTDLSEATHFKLRWR